MELEAAKVIGAGLAVIGVIGSGIGIGNIFSSFIEAVGRNPAARRRSVYNDNVRFCSCGSNCAFCTCDSISDFIWLINNIRNICNASVKS